MSDVQKSLHHYQRGLLDTLSNPKKGVSPLKWGYYFWRMLHYCFIGLLSPIPRKDMDTFLDLVMQSLPCSICRNSFAIFRSIMSLDRFWEFSPLYAPSLYFFCAHEWVNLKRGVYDLQPSSSSSLTSSVPKTVVDELEPFETKSSSMHPVETHDLTTHAPAVKSQQQTTLEGMETIRSLSSSPLSLDCSKRLSFSDVYSQYIRMDRVQIVNDFFMVCFFVIEHYPDVDKANPNIQETRKQNAAFVRHLTRVFATRLFLVRIHFFFPQPKICDLFFVLFVRCRNGVTFKRATSI